MIHRCFSFAFVLLSAAVFISIPPAAHAQRPLITTIYSADPSAHVWPGSDRLWVYGSHDAPGTNTHDTMADYHVFSTDDMVNWIDHGRVLSVDDVPWAISHAWAIDAVLWKGSYYLVYCMKEKGSGAFRTGLATSKFPQGPFKDIGPIKGVDWGQDPALFVDDDGQPYLFWGCGGGCSGAKLSDDLLSVIPGSVVNLKPQLDCVFEGPYVHKYKGKYYLSYPGLTGGKWPEEMYYAVADKPLGPYKSMGKYIPQFPGQAGTNHGSIVEYKGQWYAFHHSMEMSKGKSECRNLLADKLSYNEDGSIRPIVPDKGGVTGKLSKTTIWLEAENASMQGGRLSGTEVEAVHPGFSGPGYVGGFDKACESVKFLAQTGNHTKFRLKIGYAAPAGDQENNVLVNYRMIPDVKFPKSEKFTEVDLGVVELRDGDNYVSVIRKTGGILLDYIKLEQEP